MMNLKSKPALKNTVYVVTISMAIIGVLFITGKMFSKAKLSSAKNERKIESIEVANLNLVSQEKARESFVATSRNNQEVREAKKEDTNVKGNIMGIICPLFSFLWLVVAVVFYYGINPILYLVASNMHDYMFGGEGMVAHFGFIFAMGIIYGIFIYDFVVSVDMFKSITKFAKESGITERYEMVKEKWNMSVSLAKEHLPKIEKPDIKVASKIKSKLAKMIYIDPELEKTKGNTNYDENGRPIKIEENKEDRK